MTSSHWRLFHDTNIAMFNHLKDLDVAHDLLNALVRAILVLEQLTKALAVLRTAYSNSHDKPVHDEALAQLTAMQKGTRSMPFILLSTSYALNFECLRANCTSSARNRQYSFCC